MTIDPSETAELYRPKGELLLSQPTSRSVAQAATGGKAVVVAEPPRVTNAERCFNQSIKIAQRQSDTNYFYATDHLGSIRELTDASANLSSRFDYDPYGRRTQLSVATMNADVGFTGHFHHAVSTLALA